MNTRKERTVVPPEGCPLAARLSEFGLVLHVQADDGVGVYVTDRIGRMTWTPTDPFVSMADDIAELEEWITARELNA